MKNISYEAERKLYQALGIMQTISRIEPDGRADEKQTLVSIAYAAEGAANLLEEAAAEISKVIHG